MKLKTPPLTHQILRTTMVRDKRLLNYSSSKRRQFTPNQFRSLILSILVVLIVLMAINFLKRKDAVCDLTNECQIIPQCSCKRKLFYGLGHGRIIGEQTRLVSTCSDEASHFTQNQKVISFAFHIPKNNPDSELIQTFQNGIMENLKKLREFYPGYLMRLYTDVELEMDGEYCKIYCENEDLHWCDIRKTPSHGDLSNMYFMTWRFLPMGDETVDIFHSRDLDSIITAREKATVSDWQENYPNKSIQIMRDNWNHRFYVLGGLWGASNKVLGRHKSLQLQTSMIAMSSEEIRDARDQKTLDQLVLFNLFFTETNMKHIVAYDSYHCNSWSSNLKTLIRPFPVQRLNSKTDFVGNTGLGQDQHYIEPCPMECRPEYGKHWTYC